MQLCVIVGLKKSENKDLLDFKPTVLEAWDMDFFIKNRERVFARLAVLQNDVEYTKVKFIELTIRDKDLARVMFEETEIFGEGLKQMELIPNNDFNQCVKKIPLTVEAEVVS